MRFPTFIKKSDTIEFAAPAFGCASQPYKSAFENSLKIWDKEGFSTIIGPNCFLENGIGISNTPKECAKELMNAMLNEKSKAVISCGGGELMCEILPFMDFEKLKNADAKWFMGYSDNTNMTFLLTTLADTASIYGPCAGAFGMKKWHPAINDAFLLLQGKKNIMKNYDGWESESKKDPEHPLEPYNITEKFKLKTYSYNGESLEGLLLGGCMDCLNNLVGTKYDQVRAFNEKYKNKGIIWFLESCDLNVFDISRSLWHMREAGWFDRAKGFLIGRPMHYDEPFMGLDRHSSVISVLGELGLPIIMDLDIGHLAPMMPIVCGSYGRIKASEAENTISLEMEFA